MNSDIEKKMPTGTGSPLQGRLSLDQDAADLFDLGHTQALSRKFSIWSMLALAFCVLGTWSTFAQDLSSGLESGGPVSILWGLVLVTFCNICIAVSLGELCSSMPTALGQAYWVARLWPGKKGRFASYMCAWINTFGWWTLTASQLAFMTSFVLGIKVTWDDEWAGADEGWVQFLAHVGAVLLCTVVNLVACRRDAVLPMFNNFVGVCFVSLFVVFCLALPIAVGTNASLSFQPPSFVFGQWINETGWGDGVTWFTGLVQAAYGLTAFDSVIHMVEEMPAPRKNAPRAMWLSVTCGAVTGFIFMLICLFCIQDLDTVLDGPTGLPFIDLLHSTIGLKGTTVLVVLFIFNGLGQAVSILTTASRLTWGFARDGGLPWSTALARVDEVWKVPVRALWAQGVLIGLIGVLYLFANTVLEAILSVSTIALTISYCMPILVLMVRGRDTLPPGGTFRLGRRIGPVANGVSVVYCMITTVFFFFPGGPSPAPADMNYAIAVFGVMIVISLAFWFFKGRVAFLMTNEMGGCVVEAEREVVTEVQKMPVQGVGEAQ